jgi:hypothetical protein
LKLFIILTILTCILWCNSVPGAGDPDLVFYFPFESFDGKTALDQSGNKFNGTINGDVQIVDGGKFGKAAKFAKTSFIDLKGPAIPADKIPKDAITLCAWINCENTGDHHAIFNAQAGDATWIIHPEARSDGKFRWLLRADGGISIFDIQSGVCVWGKWQHFAGVYDGKEGILYINGEEITRVRASGKIAKDWNNGARIGYNIDNARPFTGLMDELLLWKKALGQEDIKKIMEMGGETFLAVSPAGSLSTTWGKLKK